MFHRRRLVILAAVGVFALPGQAARAQETREGIPGLDAWVERTRETFEVPGIAVAIVKDSAVVVARGYGVRRLAGDLEHWQFDTFCVRWRDCELRADAFITFELAADGSVAAAPMKAASPSVDFSYDFHDLDLRRVP